MLLREHICAQVERVAFRAKILLHSIHLSLILRKRVKVNWRIAELVVRNKYYCPCRFGKVEENRCPCKWHVEEVRRFGRCKSRLFVVAQNTR